LKAKEKYGIMVDVPLFQDVEKG